MQPRESQEAFVTAAQEGVTIANATASLFPRDNTTQSSKMNEPWFDRQPCRFYHVRRPALLLSSALFPTFVKYNVGTGMYNYAIDATNAPTAVVCTYHPPDRTT